MDVVAPFEVSTAGASHREVDHARFEAVGQRVRNLVEVREVPELFLVEGGEPF
jgi:hypothetical protein